MPGARAAIQYRGLGDWLHVHHAAFAPDHASAVRLYERLEDAGRRLEAGGIGPSGMRWGFVTPRVLLVTTTSKWGESPGFLDDLVADLDGVECFTSSEGDDREDAGPSAPDAVEAALRARLGVDRDFLWSDADDVMAGLLSGLEARPTELTTLALLPVGARATARRVPRAARAALAGRRYTEVVHGFVTPTGACVGLGSLGAADRAFAPSPLWTPLAGARLAGPGSWAIHQLLDGNQMLPLHASGPDLARMERHGGHGLWQPPAHRRARVLAALAGSSPEERQAGCALARRWRVDDAEGEVAPLVGDPDPHVREAAGRALAAFADARVTAPGAAEALGPGQAEELRAIVEGDAPVAARLIGWIRLAAASGDEDVARAMARVGDAEVGPGARWLIASRIDLDDRAGVGRLVGACAEVAGLGERFLAGRDPTRDAAFAARVAELARAASRSSYWMVRYGVPGDDRAPGPPGDWSGEPRAAADRLLHWVARAIEAAGAPDAARAALRSLVALNELLAACRANRVWWIPPVGALLAELDAVLGGDPIPRDDRAHGSAALAELRARAARVESLLAGGADVERECEAALDAIPPPLAIVWGTQYGPEAHRLGGWMANNLAWSLHRRGQNDLALPVAERAAASASWDDDAIRDTLEKIRLALGHKS